MYWSVAPSGKSCRPCFNFRGLSFANKQIAVDALALHPFSKCFWGRASFHGLKSRIPPIFVAIFVVGSNSNLRKACPIDVFGTFRAPCPFLVRVLVGQPDSA